MRVSSRADYGVRALFDLTLHFGRGPVQSRDIASRQAVPEAYLHQVLGALNRAGLVQSTRGPLGGHELARAPQEITLWDILVVLDGPDRRAHPHPEGATGADVVHDVWHELQGRSVEFLRSITLAGLQERQTWRRPVGDYAI